jgi:hypothetical protein
VSDVILNPGQLTGICGQQRRGSLPLFFGQDSVALFFKHFRSRRKLFEFFRMNQGVAAIADQSFSGQRGSAPFAV